MSCVIQSDTEIQVVTPKFKQGHAKIMQIYYVVNTAMLKIKQIYTKITQDDTEV